MSDEKWLRSSLRHLSERVQASGHRACPKTVGRLLKGMDYSLKANVKRQAGAQHPDRNTQFEYIEAQKQLFLSNGWPIISIDAKKKELIGNFKNPGRTWRRSNRDVLDHDFPSWADGRVIPLGIYDIARNRGYVSVGMSHETAAFAARAIRSWWLTEGRVHYGGVKRLAIEADCGGANNPRTWAWRVALQRLADEFGLTITVGHFPQGASKWNLIEHRMFNLISANWAGEPLVSYELVLKYIRSTRSSTGFRCRAALDRTFYPTKVKVMDDEKQSVRMTRHRVLPKWNYTIRPNKS